MWFVKFLCKSVFLIHGIQNIILSLYAPVMNQPQRKHVISDCRGCPLGASSSSSWPLRTRSMTPIRYLNTEKDPGEIKRGVKSVIITNLHSWHGSQNVAELCEYHTSAGRQRINIIKSGLLYIILIYLGLCILLQWKPDTKFQFTCRLTSCHPNGLKFFRY